MEPATPSPAATEVVGSPRPLETAPKLKMPSADYADTLLNGWVMVCVFPKEICVICVICG